MGKRRNDQGVNKFTKLLLQRNDFSSLYSNLLCLKIKILNLIK